MEKNFFIQLDTDAKTELVCNYGEHITTVETHDRLISLFILDDFFIELHIDKNNNELLETEVQDDPDVLYAYIDDLDISELFNNEEI